MLIRPKTNTEINMSYKHLSLNERNKIALKNLLVMMKLKNSE